MDSRLLQLLTALAAASRSKSNSDVTPLERGRSKLQKLLSDLIDNAPFFWSMQSNEWQLMRKLQSIGDHFKAFEAAAESGQQPKQLLQDTEYVLDWHRRLTAGEIPLEGALREGPLAVRNLQRMLLRGHWVATSGADKPDATLALYETLFSKQVWDDFNRATSRLPESDKEEDIEVDKTLKLINLVADLKVTGTRSSDNIKVLFNEIKANNEKLVRSQTACVPAAVLDWAHAQVVKICAANSLNELTALLHESPYTNMCSKIYAAQSKSTRKLLKGVRNALFIRFDEITA